MTSVTATSAYAAYSSYRYLTNNSSATSSSSSNTGSNSTASTETGATNVTLSASAQAALAAKTIAEVIAEARTTLTGLLTKADSTSPYKDGKLVIDLGSLDRRSLFAIAATDDGTFTDDEQKAAAGELSARFDAAMSGPAAVYNVTGNIQKLYQSALTYLESASDEEKATTVWTAKHDAVKQALSQLQADPQTWPVVDNDPVVDYLKRVDTGETAETRPLSSVADDARAALDAQIADARDAGKELVFSKYRKSGTKVDFSDFSSRALSAIALNTGDQFSTEEIGAAKSEIATRGRQVLINCISEANKSSDPTALAQNIISAYGSLSDEERQAVGWGDTFYQAALSNYQSASYFASIFSSDASEQSSSLLGASSGLSGLSSLVFGSS